MNNKCQFASLTIFFISYNNLEGNIPQEIWFLKQIEGYSIACQQIVDTFLSCHYNMSSINVISIALNEFDGSLPPNMFQTLLNLQYFAI
jgi:hypothetical protein